jgi:hypothetical protein
MTDETPTTETRNGDSKESEDARERSQDDKDGSSGAPAQQDNAVSPRQRPPQGRRPLFGT